VRQHFLAKYLAGLGLAILLLTHLAPRQGLAFEPLVPLAQPGPWSAVDAIIGYGPRIWFANSEVFRNHNAADIYSYDPATGAVRYERALFSQGAGRPLVAGRLLYWPFEDPRFSSDRAEFAVTNGTDWAWRVLPEGTAYHFHAMAALDGKLYAATSAWRAGLQVSADNGASWQVLYDHPTPKGQVSRISSLATFQGHLHAGLVQQRGLGRRVLTVTEDGVVPAPGWPDAKAARGLTAYRGNLFAILQDEAGRRLWRGIGGRAKPVADGPSDQPLRALAAGEDARLRPATAKARFGSRKTGGNGPNRKTFQMSCPWPWRFTRRPSISAPSVPAAAARSGDRGRRRPFARPSSRAHRPICPRRRAEARPLSSIWPPSATWPRRRR
jgi:hypothetical protein